MRDGFIVELGPIKPLGVLSHYRNSVRSFSRTTREGLMQQRSHHSLCVSIQFRDWFIRLYCPGPLVESHGFAAVGHWAAA